MEYQTYINEVKKIQDSVLNFVDNENDSEETYQNMIKTFDDHQIKTDKIELKLFIRMLSQIINCHHVSSNFFNKIEKIILYLKEEIISNFDNDEIFNFFIDNKRILLFLINEKILEVDESIYEIIKSDEYKKKCYNKYFFNEIRPFLKPITIKNMSKSLPLDFEEKRNSGQSDDQIVELIRNDSLEEFINYVKKKKLSILKSLPISMFETNKFLLKKNNVSLINYAAFYGSIKIFDYLLKQNVKIEPIIWLFAIHSNSIEMIHILEENNIKPKNDSFKKCLKESIKCHHNDIANYLLKNYLPNIEMQSLNCMAIKGFNFLYFQDELENLTTFSFLCEYDYFSLAKLLLNCKHIDINSKIKKTKAEIKIAYFMKLF